MSWLTFFGGVLVGLLIAAPILRILLRRVEARVRAAERRARQSERLAELGSMTSGLAHEIRNPLSTIGLNAQLLAEGISEARMDDDERDRLRRRTEALGRETERLRGILEDFLRFAGRIRLDPQPCDLVRLVDEVADFYHPQCDQQGIVLRTQLPRVPIEIALDEGLFKQALLNLMINATQAMASSVPIAADGVPRGDLILRVDTDADHVSVHVIDTGPGIPDDKIEEIFRPYVSHRRAGTGLGLPTARRIVEEHGGRLVVHSEPGKGSDFVIELPRATPRPSA
ncbi:MAG: HAMP domain-containing histidine kinase [Phycisphaerales bacterium]|nr:HAMP domain-containing histidine kinase [Phycisphaerales bacterium]